METKTKEQTQSNYFSLPEGKTFFDLELEALAYRVDNEIGVTTYFDENGDVEAKDFPSGFEYNARLLNRRGVEHIED